MIINKENYGQYIVDYYDGKLSSEEEVLLLSFLEQHPALRNEWDAFAAAPLLEKENIPFPEKEKLKHPAIVAVGPIHELNYTKYFVWAHDEELSPEERNDVKAFLAANPQLKKEFLITEKIKVTPDEAVSYPGKEQLKKRSALSMWPYMVSAVAALLLLFLGVRLLILQAPARKTYPVFAAKTIACLPSKTLKFISVQKKAEIKKKKENRLKRTKQKKPTQKNRFSLPTRHDKPVNMLAAANIYPVFEQEKDYAPLRFPVEKMHVETITFSKPVVVENVRKNSLFRSIGKPFSELAAVIALQKRKRKMTNSHEKGFVKVLEKGMKAVNAFTDNDMVMVKTYDANGNLIDYRLLSDNFSINRPVKSENR